MTDLTGADLRLPEHRRETFQRFYSFHLRYRTHPGLVYLWLPALAEHHDLDADGRAWAAWLNGNTQNPVTTSLLLDAAPTIARWPDAVNLWRERYADLEWDTDRRYQKARFEAATLAYVEQVGHRPADAWRRAAAGGWAATWRFASALPWMGRLSAWSLTEFARILLGPEIPDASTLLVGDQAGSRSHRNGLGLIAGYESTYWKTASAALVRELADLGTSLVAEARERNPGSPDVGYLSMESALCTYKGWHKPNRRYPNVYADMAVARLQRAQERFGDRFAHLWEARRISLPQPLRLEDSPRDPGLAPAKQNHYLETGRPVMIGHDYPDMLSTFDRETWLP